MIPILIVYVLNNERGAQPDSWFSKTAGEEKRETIISVHRDRHRVCSSVSRVCGDGVTLHAVRRKQRAGQRDVKYCRCLNDKEAPALLLQGIEANNGFDTEREGVARPQITHIDNVTPSHCNTISA